MSTKHSNPSFAAGAFMPSNEQSQNGHWLAHLVRRYLEVRRQNQRRAEGLAIIRKLPRYLQDDVGMKQITKIDE